jgi:carotenoid cleavage dioxygenase
MLSRRRFLELAFSLPIVGACGRDATLPEGVAIEPLPDDPTKPWWLRKDFAPVAESEAHDLKIVGALPPELSGLYLRNGPNPMGADSTHWFTGDGMVHGIRLAKGKAPWYRARYVKTEALGTGNGKGPPTLTRHQANTSVVAHRDRLLCLEEIGVPYRISKDDLSTLGPYDFAGKLQTAMTAHPKLDAATGELLFFGYGLFEPIITFHRVDASGQLVNSEKIALKKAVMMHDFQITASHVVFMDLPIVFDLDLAVAGGGFPFRWAPENGARIGVMPRAGKAAEVKWLDIDPCFVFHTWNAFHDPQSPNIIHMDCVRYPKMWEKGASDFSAAGAPHRFSVDLGAGKVTVTQLDDRAAEFPRINPARQGLSYRFGYGLASTRKPEIDGSSPTFDTVVKYDRQTGMRQARTLAASQELDEAMFVAHPAAKNEDDGWLLAYVFDHSDNRSQLWVLDASNLAAAPVARVLLPRRVPHGFHGEFLRDA